ncbi:UNVERIFIED_CONTAM: hypothetical protein FKN15_015491 [Acipenser sinensis]
MPFRIKLRRTRRYNVLSKNCFVTRIRLLDSNVIECTLSVESTGQECLEAVAQRLELREAGKIGFMGVIRQIYRASKESYHYYNTFIFEKKDTPTLRRRAPSPLSQRSDRLHAASFSRATKRPGSPKEQRERETPAKPAVETLINTAQPTPSQVMMPPMTRDQFFQWMGKLKNLKQARPPQPVTHSPVSGTPMPTDMYGQHYSAEAPLTMKYSNADRYVRSALLRGGASDDDVEKQTEAPAPIYTIADAVLRRICFEEDENDVLSIIDARDKIALEGFPFH